MYTYAGLNAIHSKVEFSWESRAPLGPAKYRSADFSLWSCSTSDNDLNAGNAACGLCQACKGHYGNAIQSLESLGVDSPPVESAWSELVKHHPQRAFDSFLP